MKLRIEHPPGYEPERRYAFEVVLREFLGLDYCVQVRPGAEVRLSLADGPCDRVLVLPDRLFATPTADWLGPRSLPRRPLPVLSVPPALAEARVMANAVPVVYGGRAPDAAVFAADEAGGTLRVDVFGGVFFLLTRYEELVDRRRDAHGRFPDRAALAYREGFLHRPLANEYVELLWAAMRWLWPRIRRRPRRFRALLTHDVDWPLCTAGRNWLQVGRRAALDILRRRDLGPAEARVRSYLKTRRGDITADLWNTFDRIMDLSERCGLQSAFYFITERTAGNLDGTADIDDPWIRALLRRVHARGHEVGLHGSYHSAGSPARIARQFARLRAVCAAEGIDQTRWGGRQHYLRWENPTTWQGWADAGLQYDSTLGFAGTTGFRAGTCYEYPVFNLRTRRPLALRERPLVAMEQAAFTAAGFDLEAACTRLIAHARVCRRFDGDFVLLWHNNWLATDAERLCYRAVLDALAGGAW
jgi:peptidoglycan/xylan/chitin deacetylase (PgdA/CDA1 family)